MVSAPDAPSSRIDRSDLLVVLGVLILAASYGALCMRAVAYPMEDAAMLMRYAKNLGEGHGFVWNVGEPPVDGATDFLFTVIVGGLVRCGIAVETAVRGIGIVSHLLTVLLVYVAVRRLHMAHRAVAALSAAYLALGPGPSQLAAYFGTPLFVLSAAACWYQANNLVSTSREAHAPWVWAFSCLIMGLIRPEGVFLALFMLMAIVYVLGAFKARRILIAFLCVFGLVGGAYFFWRWHYFGHPLPNPFYKKGGGRLHFWSLGTSIRNALELSLPFIPAFILGCRSKRSMRATVFALFPIAGFTGIWVLLSGIMNHYARFQYPVLPLVLISWAGLVRGLADEWDLPSLAEVRRRSPMATNGLLAAIALGILLYQVVFPTWRGTTIWPDGEHDIAVMLNDYGGRGYTLATTEAGLLPLYSGWRAIDTWGLNDPWIAHHGEITAEYLGKANPEVLMVHALSTPLTSHVGADASDGDYLKMVRTLQAYAEDKGYILAADFGWAPDNSHYYYVRPDFLDSAKIVDRIRKTDYRWFANGKKAIDYAALSPCVDGPRRSVP